MALTGKFLVAADVLRRIGAIAQRIVVQAVVTVIGVKVFEVLGVARVVVLAVDVAIEIGARVDQVEVADPSVQGPVRLSRSARSDADRAAPRVPATVIPLR